MKETSWDMTINYMCLCQNLYDGIFFFIFHEFQNKKDDGLSLLLNNLRRSNNVLITNDFY